MTQLCLHAATSYALTELAQAARVPLSTAHRDVARLVDTGLVASRSVGRTRLYQANADVEAVLLFGSWAARYAGQDGPPPADIDVLVIGTPHRAAVYAAADRAAARLHLR